MKRALLFYGGWEGHEPFEISLRFERILRKNGFETEIHEGTSCLSTLDLSTFDLIVPGITAGELSKAGCEAIDNAIASGTGLAGCHGGMCDAFRNSPQWQFITGGQWVAHPGGTEVEYSVNIVETSNPIVKGICDFSICSEQYYLHVDPAIEVLATTRFPVANGRHVPNKPVDMPVVWTKYWGHGRVFYCSLGHHNDLFDKSPEAALIMERGMLWAAEGKKIATENLSDVQMFEIK